jgi:hypothetical protein
VGKLIEFEMVNKEVERQVGWVCDYCGKEVRNGWWFHPSGWVHIISGGDPIYSWNSLMCEDCIETGAKPNRPKVKYPVGS